MSHPESADIKIHNLTPSPYLIGTGLAVLAVAILAQCFGLDRQRRHWRAPDVAALLPREIPGWTIEDRPVAETPELQKNVEKILRFDGAVFRIYRSGRTEIGVYIAYWLPGKVPVSTVDAHTPDICWVDNGWSMKSLPSPSPQTRPQGTVAIPNCRSFTFSGQTIEVAYWHLVGSDIRGQESVAEGKMAFGERVKRRFQQVCRSIVSPPRQQVFLRFSCNGSLQDGLATAPAADCLDLLARAMAGETFYTHGN